MSQKDSGGGVGGVYGSLYPYMGFIRIAALWPVGNVGGFLACLVALCV